MNTQDLSPQVFYEFKSKLENEGYFKRAYLYYFLLIISTVSCFIFSIAILFLYSDSLLIQMVNAIFFGVILTQIGIIGHDFSHNQVFKSPLKNKAGGIIAWSLFAGMSESKWYLNHNEHHKEVNHSEHDPDLQMPFIFDDEQIVYKKNSYRFLRKYQHLLFFLILPLVYPIYIIRSLGHDIKYITPLSVVELVLMAVHYILFFWLLFSNLPILTAIVFIFLFSFVVGAYMGLIFAPNHKGMPMVAQDQKVEWWHQIVCTRNLYPNRFIFHAMGGLNYQIEHHLFTSMPRINYPKVAPLIKEFCSEHDLAYYETSWTDSMKEIYTSLKQHRNI